MFRLALLATALLLSACASTRTNALIAGDSSDGFVVTAPDSEALPPELAAPESAGYVEPFGKLEFEASPSDAVEPAPLSFSQSTESTSSDDESLHSSRFTIKGGLYSSEEDTIEDGWIVNLSWMTYFSKLFALEFELGYLDADGEDSGVEADLWAVPIMVNARLNLPIWVIDFYGGAGLGGFYYDVEVDAGVLSDDDDGFLFGGNAFLGGSINIADKVSLGLEAKYYITEEIDDYDESLDALAVMLTLGFSR